MEPTTEPSYFSSLKLFTSNKVSACSRNVSVKKYWRLFLEMICMFIFYSFRVSICLQRAIRAEEIIYKMSVTMNQIVKSGLDILQHFNKSE